VGAPGRLTKAFHGALLGRALSQNPCNVFGNGNRDDGNCDGNSYLLDDGHAENGSTQAGQVAIRRSVAFLHHKPFALLITEPECSHGLDFGRLRLADLRFIACLPRVCLTYLGVANRRA
jgi:hypothetical protein